MRLGRLRRLHLMGIGGAGMCALAELALADGLVVSGCDLEASPRTEHLVELGAKVLLGHASWHLDEADVLGVSAAVSPEEPEVAAAREAGIPVVSRGQLLAEAMRGRVGLAVAGTHGKTTTSALTAFLLSEAGLDPAALLGGRAMFLQGHAMVGDGEILVCEADEYARTFLDLHPAWLVITNVEAEHLDIYGSVQRLEAAFAELAARVPFWGRVIFCADDAGASRVASACGRPSLGYGLGRDAELTAVDLEPVEGGWTFGVQAGGRPLCEVRLPMPGRHNVMNALGALAAATEAGAEPGKLPAALERFRGVERRLEILGERDGVLVVDDYAHHPTEIGATLDSVRQAWPERRLVVVFEPHLFSRTAAFSDEFGRRLAEADRLVLLPIYPARERPMPGVDSALVARAARSHGAASVLEAPSYAAAAEALEGLLEPGDLLLSVGAGDVREVGETWLGEGA